MGIREALNENRRATIAVTVVVVAVIVGWMVYDNLLAHRSVDVGGDKAFFTDDDGVTWFADSADKVPPFDHNGKQAVLCYVYKCGAGGQPFVASLLRYTPEGKKMREAHAGEKKRGGPLMMDSASAGVEVKRPKTGDSGWVKINDPRAMAIQELKCPDGANGQIEPVVPE